MAQAEDTELSDLVIEALEKNGSLAKIRALLRANIFLAFEEDYENVKQNANLDSILKLPEGILSLSIVHEFLEFCNLKNTLFVYMSESRQGKEYVYEGQKTLSEKLKLSKFDNVKEPLIVTLIKNILKPFRRKYLEHGDMEVASKPDHGDTNYKDEQNCTYIVHEDSATSQSHSDNSSDEKNKLHLRLQLDNSDTDTSSDSTRDKSSSEYIPNEHIVKKAESGSDQRNSPILHTPIHFINPSDSKKIDNFSEEFNTSPYYVHNNKISNNNSSDSTSYLDMNPYNAVDTKLMNTAGVPITEDYKKDISLDVDELESNLQHDHQLAEAGSLSTSSKSIVSNSSKKDHTEEMSNSHKNSLKESNKSELETAGYSFDFTSVSKNLEAKKSNSPRSIEDKLSLIESLHHSHSSQSSVSLSDVADLVEYSDKSSEFNKKNNLEQASTRKNELSHHKNASKSNSEKKILDDSGDFSGSSVPSLSNLSLDIHSD